jgi:hypothetical protein
MAKATMEIVLDCAEPQRLKEFWLQALDYRSLWSSDDLVVLVPGDGVRPPLLLQRVPEPRLGKNRMHIDIVNDDVEAEVRRLEAAGAVRAHEGLRELAGTFWVTMADPEGNEFCVSTGIPW